MIFYAFLSLREPSNKGPSAPPLKIRGGCGALYPTWYMGVGLYSRHAEFSSASYPNQREILKPQNTRGRQVQDDGLRVQDDEARFNGS